MLAGRPWFSRSGRVMRIPTYIVNLDRHVERWAHMQAEAARIGLDVERLSAVDGFRVPAELRPKFFDEAGRNPSGLLPGEIGCLLTMTKVRRREIASSAAKARSQHYSRARNPA